jgi:protein-disulfide isomerase
MSLKRSQHFSWLQQQGLFLIFMMSLFMTIFAAPLAVKATVQAVPDIVVGQDNAPITMIEYSSLNCTACAYFHQKVFPTLKAKYIDTGKVRFIFRHFPLDEQAAEIAAVISTAPAVKQFTLIQRVFEHQQKWSTASQPLQVVSQIVDIPFAVCQAAAKDKKLTDAVFQKRLEAEKELTIEGTPTFIINGRIIGYAPSLEKLESYLAPQPSKKKA